MTGYKDAIENGYKEAYPDRETVECDKRIAEKFPCEACGGKMEYKPLIKGDSYRAFAICAECKAEEEF